MTLRSSPERTRPDLSRTDRLRKTRTTRPTHPARLLLGLAAGLCLFGAGLGAALVYLPEWHAPALPDRKAVAARVDEIARQAGFQPAGDPRLRLAARTLEQGESYRVLGDEGCRWLTASGTALVVEAMQAVRDPRRRLDGYLLLDLAQGRAPQTLTWTPRNLVAALATFDAATQVRLAESLAPLLLRHEAGERLGSERQDTMPNVPRLGFAIEGADPPHNLYGLAGHSVFLARRPGTLGRAVANGSDPLFSRSLNRVWIGGPAVLGVLALFAALMAQRRISAFNGLLLAALALPTLDPLPTVNAFSIPFGLVAAAALLLWLAILWSCAESLLRSSDPDFTTSLDALRTGRLGPRGGRSLLVGCAVGAALAGAKLSLLSLANVVPGIWPTAPSLSLPLSQPMASPLASAILGAAWVALALALARRFLPLPWAPYAATAIAALLAPAIPLGPLAPGFAASAAAAGVLVYTARRHGLTALLATSLSALLLPGAAFAFLHRDWMPVSAFLLPASFLALAVLGYLGLKRSPAAEIERLTPPDFVRRLEDDRRLRHEMDLLARMQKGLLPRTLPSIPGWEIAARSVQAHEAGGDLYDVLEGPDGALWIAVGDVAGHGYSCAIAQAMAKAALTSLIGTGRPPAKVLQRLDQVMRAGGADRNFTTLALLRLRPESGEAVFTNAGHPFPLLLDGGELSEIELPSLPLGRGPARTYREAHLHLPPGTTLVFFSDGLFEAVDRGGQLYGYERLRARVRKQRGRSAERIVQGLFGDWERHLRTVRPLDDTTVLVVQRLERPA